MIKLPEYIENLSRYVGGKPIEELAREKGISKIVKLASNENALGPSPLAMEAVKNNLNEIYRYPDPKCYELTKVIAGRFNIPQERIFVAGGSDAILQYILTTVCEKDDEVLTSQGTFIGWYVNSAKYNIKCVKTVMDDFSYDLEAILAAISDKTKIIYLANPNNPTGTIFTRKQFENFLERVPENILIVLDEAYTLYAGENPEYPDGLDYTKDNLFVSRTFSKDYGLAGLRIGAGFGDPQLVEALYKMKLPFEPNLLAQVGAIAALNDKEHIEKTIEMNRRSLNRFREAFDEIGLDYTKSYGNFLLLTFPESETAAKFTNDCLDRGLILRHTVAFGVPNGVRINSAAESDTEFAIEVIREVMKKIEVIIDE
ncbi:MAG: histidinol-phosphate transaminase [Ignavibacteriales bacterium]|nr:histidinol-phosphate transaminase [Ignavibacteria bacterium]MBZ0195809.1 histidinol-phosphate transaminase [Ignavibacteriaceae bacterium]MCZ2144039.1 histidinol-phosphate transaminase [Ignavibacteriales bacterium]WKZ73346.1 MAG: histidinol-phosphate transaminase [Ignavibacteriaceae bacterium]